MCFLASRDRPKEKPRRFERARCPVQAGVVRHEIILPSATVYSSFLCRLSHCHSTETRCKSLRTFAKIFLMCLRPQPAQDERPFDRLKVLSPERSPALCNQRAGRSRGTRIGAERSPALSKERAGRSPPRWGGRASFRRPIQPYIVLL